MEQELRGREVPAQEDAVEVALRAAWYDVPVEVVGQHVLDSRKLEVPDVAAGTVVADVALMLGIRVAAVDLVELLDRVHNLCSRLIALSYDHNRGNAWFALPSFFVMILLPVGYHYVIFQEKRCRAVSSWRSRGDPLFHVRPVW
jgi:hypothetical protein